MATIEREGGDRAMDDQGRGSGPRPQGAEGPAEAGTAEPLPYEGVWRFTAPAVDASVPQARHAVRDLLRRQGVPVPDDVAQGLLLIVSELVTNAVRHAALLSPMLAVEVAVGAEWIRVSVEDNHPYRPTALEADHGRTGGRGLLLVREITREAGGACDVEHTASGGKVVWVALPLRPARFQPAAGPPVTSPPTAPSAPGPPDGPRPGRS
ncbi:ATP-binding protein [Streptomyces griseomycini]|uniref:Anti-sigma regulatory factor (Ser/Thr protein kinase) n=1 Tax=Streptomyces griseomycini TaxID=66895 RepID=A0A7W7V9E4_9ACTN|nr:anti-sigma regulatory factor (Ser/Thr protein kinase) [Streptomyces griseomycini]GGQ29785.1 ATP-binding protein [Streptomyces griseomycini]GGR49627.1 ATP-binding protein [Streptomyces griseomycini]